MLPPDHEDLDAARDALRRAGLAPIAGGAPEGDPPAGDPSAADPPAADPPAGDPPPDPDAGAKAALDAERKARRAAEKAAREAAAKLKEREDADKSELEKAQERLKELETKESASVSMYRDAQLMVELAKPEHGITNAKAAAKLIEGVTFTDDHEPEGIEEAVKALREDVPGLFTDAPAPSGGSPANPPRGGGKKPPVTPGFDRLTHAYGQNSQ